MAFCGSPVPFDAKKQGENGHTWQNGHFSEYLPHHITELVAAKMFLYDRAEYRHAHARSAAGKVPFSDHRRSVLCCGIGLYLDEAFDVHCVPRGDD